MIAGPGNTPIHGAVVLYASASPGNIGGQHKIGIGAKMVATLRAVGVIVRLPRVAPIGRAPRRHDCHPWRHPRSPKRDDYLPRYSAAGPPRHVQAT